MATRVAVTLLAGLLVLFGAVAAACDGDGGDGELTLEEFFQRVQELDDQFEAGSDALDAQFDEFDQLSEEDALERTPGLLQQQADLVEEFVDGLDALEVPDEAAELQDEAVSAGRDVVTAFNDLLDDVEVAETFDALFGIFEDEAFLAAVERFEQACLDAEELAADNGITVELNCEEEEE